MSRIEIGLGTMAVIVGAGPFVVPAPAFFGPLFGGPPWPLELLRVIAYTALLGGYAWMLRIRFRGPEDGARSNWRSH